MIAIIGLLAGLLLPAVQRARESGRRATCANKLTQLAKACQQYAAANGAYPAAFSSSRFARMVPMSAYAGSCGSPPTATSGTIIGDFSDDQSPAWTIAILPFLGQQPRFDSFVPHQSGGAYDGAYGGGWGTNLAAAYTPNNAYQCPSDPMSDSSETNTNYFGVSGGFAGTAGQSWFTVPPAGRAPKDGYLWFAANGGAHFNNGIIHINGRVTDGAILDGLSNTFLVGETRYQWTLRSEQAIAAFNSSYGVGRVSRPSWAGGARNWGCGGTVMLTIVSTHASTSRTGINVSGCSDMFKAPPLLDSASNCSQPYQFMQGDFGSFHPGGCHFALADGAVKFVDEMIDFSLYRRLGVKADGQLMSGLPW